MQTSHRGNDCVRTGHTLHASASRSLSAPSDSTAQRQHDARDDDTGAPEARVAVHGDLPTTATATATATAIAAVAIAAVAAALDMLSPVKFAESDGDDVEHLPHRGNSHILPAVVEVLNWQQ